jgi:hypothetical protein
MSMNKNRLKHYASKVKSDAYGLDRIIHARIAGVTFDGRQEKVAKLLPTTQLKLERDRRNEYDFHAVAVMAELGGSWEHVGFIPRAMSKLISRSLDNGVELVATMHRLTGGMLNEETGENLHFGLEIKITPPSTTNS